MTANVIPGAGIHIIFPKMSTPATIVYSDSCFSINLKQRLHIMNKQQIVEKIVTILYAYRQKRLQGASKFSNRTYTIHNCESINRQHIAKIEIARTLST